MQAAATAVPATAASYCAKQHGCVLTRQLKVVPTAKLLAIVQLLLEASALLPLLLLHTLTTPSDVPMISCKGLQVSEGHTWQQLQASGRLSP